MRTLLTSVTAFILMGVVLSAQKVSTDFNPSAPFGSYKTYTWTAGTPARDPFAEERIRAAVNNQLAAKGLTENDTAPNLVVATHVTTANQQQVIAPGFGWGPWGWGGPGPMIENYVEGTLIVDLYDATTKKLVWRGVATSTLSDKTSKNTDKMEKALTKMFEKYPPFQE